jgi:glycosyltransferase involved in cell wall biosynthesis
MRILLVAYDFPPTRTPRALRWRYLSRELVLLGHEVHVLVPDLGDVDVEFPNAPGRLYIHRSWAGPFGWLVRRSQRRHAGAATSRSGQSAVARQPAAGTRLNWRGRLVETAKQLCGLVMFPDVRAEWSPWARRALRRILQTVQPGVVVTSHEPATTLPLGRMAQRMGFLWVADLGDPVCANYTSQRWRRRAWKLEAMVSHSAETVLVTTEATRQLLIDRHGQDPGRCIVLPNGYDDRHAAAGRRALDFDAGRLELIYTGRLYGYRDPSGLLQAAATTPGVRLTIVVPDPPEGRVARLIEGAGNLIRVSGYLPHEAVMELLEAADVLVNVGDAGGSVQVPAKVYEYLGLERPILHVLTGPDDTVAAMLRPLQRGWICNDDPDRLGAFLEQLLDRKRRGLLHEGLSLAPVTSYAHSSLGQRLSSILLALRDRDVAGPEMNPMVEMDCNPGERVGQRVMTLEARLERTLDALELQRQREENIVHSVSWRLTRPMRALVIRWRGKG